MSKVINNLVFIVLFFICICPHQAKSQQHIAITQIAEHPALDLVKAGVEEALAGEGIKNCKITFDNAQGNIPIASQIAQKFAGMAPDVIIAISTPSALSCVKAADGKIPVVFAAVTNPKEAGLNQKNVTGVSDYVPVEKMLDLAQEILKREVKTIGVPFNPGEPSAVFIIERLREACLKKKIKLIEATVSKVSEVPDAARKLVSSCEVIIEISDNTISSAISLLIKEADAHKIPLIVADGALVEQGGLASVSVDYKDHGKSCGKIAARILKGENPSKIAISFVDNPKIFINKKAASKIGVVFNEEFIKKSKIIE